MVSIHVDIDELEWMPGSAKYGAVAIHDEKEIIESKILSDRRAAGGGLALLSRVSPPPGKLVKIVAVARSDEHVFNLGGGRGTKSGTPNRSSPCRKGPVAAATRMPSRAASASGRPRWTPSTPRLLPI